MRAALSGVVLSCLLILSMRSANAATYNINIFGHGGLPGTSYSWSYGSAGAYLGLDGYQSAFYEFPTGGTVNLGTLSFTSGILFDEFHSSYDVAIDQLYENTSVQEAFSFWTSIFGGQFLAGCTTVFDPNCPNDLASDSETENIHLLFVVPPGGGIQVAFAGPDGLSYTYEPPTPLPPTWTMMLPVLLGFGFFANSLSRKSNAATATGASSDPSTLFA
jgi:hypothetical protein